MKHNNDKSRARDIPPSHCCIHRIHWLSLIPLPLNKCQHIWHQFHRHHRTTSARYSSKDSLSCRAINITWQQYKGNEKFFWLDQQNWKHLTCMCDWTLPDVAFRLIPSMRLANSALTPADVKLFWQRSYVLRLVFFFSVSEMRIASYFMFGLPVRYSKVLTAPNEPIQLCLRLTYFDARQ